MVTSTLPFITPLSDVCLFVYIFVYSRCVFCSWISFYCHSVFPIHTHFSPCTCNLLHTCSRHLVSFPLPLACVCVHTYTRLFSCLPPSPLVVCVYVYIPTCISSVVSLLPFYAVILWQSVGLCMNHVCCISMTMIYHNYVHVHVYTCICTLWGHIVENYIKLTYFTSMLIEAKGYLCICIL